jgi:hypothetical protein
LLVISQFVTPPAITERCPCSISQIRPQDDRCIEISLIDLQRWLLIHSQRLPWRQRSAGDGRPSARSRLSPTPHGHVCPPKRLAVSARAITQRAVPRPEDPPGIERETDSRTRIVTHLAQWGMTAISCRSLSSTTAVTNSGCPTPAAAGTECPASRAANPLTHLAARHRAPFCPNLANTARPSARAARLPDAMGWSTTKRVKRGQPPGLSGKNASIRQEGGFMMDGHVFCCWGNGAVGDTSSRFRPVRSISA